MIGTWVPARYNLPAPPRARGWRHVTPRGSEWGSSGAGPSHLSVTGVCAALSARSGRLPRPWGPASGRVGCIASPHPALAEVSPVPAEHGIPRGHPGAPRRPPMAGLVPALSQQPGALPPLGDDTSSGVCFCPLVCPGRDCQAALHFRSGSDTAGLLRRPQEASDWWR